MVSTSNERYPESEDKHMRLNKLFIGLALGLTLAAGTASTAEAKAKPVVVTVDKADASTAKKVDTAFKKGKVVTLKVRGSKKASKALLIDLQKKTAETMRYSVHFDLDDGNRDCEGKGNKFHTYKDLDYKQSGNYGCYTFSKSTCNAYKYAFKFIKGNVDRQMKSVKEEYNRYKTAFEKKSDNLKAYDTAMMSLFEDIASDNINKATFQFFDDFLVLYVKESTGEVAEGSVDKLITEALSNGADEGVVEEIVSEAKKYNLKKSEPMSIDEFIKERYGNDTLKFYKGGALEVAFSDKWSCLVVRGLYLGMEDDKDSSMIYGGKKSVIDYDKSRQMKAYKLMKSTDEFRFKSLIDKAAQGVCADYTCVNRALLDYVGCCSYYVGNAKADHAVCAINFNDKLAIFSNENFEFLSATSFSGNSRWSGYGWDKCFKDAMGSDYPF